MLTIIFAKSLGMIGQKEENILNVSSISIFMNTCYHDTYRFWQQRRLRGMSKALAYFPA